MKVALLKKAAEPKAPEARISRSRPRLRLAKASAPILGQELVRGWTLLILGPPGRHVRHTFIGRRLLASLAMLPAAVFAVGVWTGWQSAAEAQPTATPSDGVVVPDAMVDRRWRYVPYDEDSALAGEPASVADLSTVYWTVPRAMTLSSLAFTWGVPKERLAALNPDLPAGALLDEGQPVVVYMKDNADPTRSVGAPNRGSLVNGVPMPEGPSWLLRPGRRRVYGTPSTVAALVRAFEAYGRTFPGAPPIRLGDLSSRGGGLALPHRSHRTGRDVDIGYVVKVDPNSLARPWRRTTSRNFDGEKNWFIISSLIDSGSVQSIYMSDMRRDQLYEAALAERPAEELAPYFDKIAHQDGHEHHMHVRFACEPTDLECRSMSVPGEADHDGDDVYIPNEPVPLD